MTDFQISRDDWDKLTNILERVDRTVTQLLEREKYRDSEIARSQEMAKEAISVAYEAKSMAEKAQMSVRNTSQNMDRWQDWAFRISAALVVAGVAGLIGYLVAA